MGKRQNTQQQILKLLRRYGELSVGEAVAGLRSSEATVRRHFADLEQQGELIRIYGGVRLPAAAGGEYFYRRSSVTNLNEKRAIGAAAAALITEHDRLFFDSGTTVLECGNALIPRLEKRELSDINVVTNSLVYSDGLAEFCPVALTGGVIRNSRMDLAGVGAMQSLERYNFTKAVLGADAVAPDGRLSTTDEDTALLASAAVRRSHEVLILADSSKLGGSSFVDYGVLEKEHFTLITDRNADEKLLQKWAEQGVRIITV